MAKPWGKRPPSPKRFRVVVDCAHRDVTCLTDVRDHIKEAFRAGANSVTVLKLTAEERRA